MAVSALSSPPLSPAGLDRWLEGSGVAVAASDP